MRSGLWLLLLLAPSPPAAAHQRCARWFTAAQQSKVLERKGALFVKAATCWRQSAGARRKKEHKGALLRNAITALVEGIQVLRRQKREAKADALRQRAIAWLRLHHRQRLEFDAAQRSKLRRLRQKLAAQLRYSSLEVFTGSQAARVCVVVDAKPLCKRTRWWSHKKLLAGPYRIQVKYPTGPIQSRTIQLRRGVEHPEYFTPPYSTLAVSTGDPRARIEVIPARGSRRVARGAKATFAQMPVGRYQIAVTYPFAGALHKRVQLRRRQPTIVAFRPPPPRLLRLHSRPPGALVTIDQKPRGATPLAGVSLGLGVHRLRLEKPCYLPLEVQLKVHSKGAVRRSFQLRRDPAWLHQRRAAQAHRRRLQSRSLLGWLLTGGGATFAVAGAIFLGLGLSENAKAQQLRAQDKVAFYTQYAAIGRTGNLLGGVGLALSGLALAALAPGLYLKLVPPPKWTPTRRCQIPLVGSQRNP